MSYTLQVFADNTSEVTMVRVGGYGASMECEPTGFETPCVSLNGILINNTVTVRIADSSLGEVLYWEVRISGGTARTETLSSAWCNLAGEVDDPSDTILLEETDSLVQVFLHSTTDDSSGGDDGGDEYYYYYDCYDYQNKTWFNNEIGTNDSRIQAPEKPNYTYLGYSVDSVWNASLGPVYTDSSCTQHNIEDRYIVFYYKPTSSGGGGETTDPLDDPRADHTSLTGGTYHVKLSYDLVGGTHSYIPSTISGSSNVVDTNGAGGANIPITSYTPTRKGYSFLYWKAIDLSTGRYIDDEFGNDKIYQKGTLYFWPGSTSSSKPKEYEIEAFWTSGSSTSTDGKVKVYTSAGWKDCTPYVCVEENGVLTWKECQAYVNTTGTSSGWTITKI